MRARSKAQRATARITEEKRTEKARRAAERRARLNARDRDIVRRYRAGENTAEIAADYGITRQRVTQIARNARVPPRPHPIHFPREPKHDSWIAQARAARGWTQVDLAEATGLSRTTIQRAERGGDMTERTYEKLRAVLIEGSGRHIEEAGRQ